MKFIDISGFGNCGKGAVSDFLREINKTYVPASSCEFDLLRVPGGLIDLSHALIDNWSPIRANAALKRFKSLAERSDTKPFYINPISAYNSNGFNYRTYFKGNFKHLSNLYINKLIEFKTRGTIVNPEISPGRYTFERIQKKLRIKSTFPENWYGVSGINFLKYTQEYLISLFQNVCDPNTNIVVTHNAIEPFNPSRGLELFGNSKVIVVHRDPRDIYASVLREVESKIFVPDYEKYTFANKLKQEVIQSDNVDLFIKRQMLLYSNRSNSENSSRVYNLQYEYFVLNYQEETNKLMSFLEIPIESHISKNKFFKPEISKANIGLWKEVTHNKSIARIEQELMPFCINIANDRH